MSPANHVYQSVEGRGGRGRREGGRSEHTTQWRVNTTRSYKPTPDLLLRDSVVANEGVGEGQYLVAIGGVSQGLHIAHHPSLEHCSTIEYTTSHTNNSVRS